MSNLARVIVQYHFELLGKRDYAQIARRLRVPRTLVEAAARFIQRNLTPYPARAFWGEGKVPDTEDASTAFSDPDINISFFNQSLDGPLMVEVFTPFSGWLRVNPRWWATRRTTTSRPRCACAATKRCWPATSRPTGYCSPSCRRRCTTPARER